MNFNAGVQGAGQQGSGGSGVNPWVAFGAGLAGGAGADAAIGTIKGIASDAKWGKWLSLANTGSGLLTGNAATSAINAAMANFNAVANPATPTQADITNIKAGGQNLALAMQNLNPLQYFGASASTQATTSPSATPAAASTSNTAILAAAVILAVVLSNNN